MRQHTAYQTITVAACSKALTDRWVNSSHSKASTSGSGLPSRINTAVISGKWSDLHPSPRLRYTFYHLFAIESVTTMTTLTEIESAIKQLPENDVQQLAIWLQSYVNDPWDQQLESDLQSGRLDNLISKAEADIATHHLRDLDEVIHNT
jgi:hypothetical protein